MNMISEKEYETAEEASISALWRGLFEERGYEHKIIEVANRYPEQRSVYVEFMDIAMFNEDLLNNVLDSPIHTLRIGEEAIKEFLPAEKQELPLHLRLFNIPPRWRTPIRKIRSIHLSKFVSTEGIVRKADIVRPQIVVAAFKCMRCNALITETQDDYVFKTPLECYKDQGGCGRSSNATKFRFVSEKSTFMDVQFLEIQEKPEGLRGGEQPQFLRGVAVDDIAGMVVPGDRVVLNGVIVGQRPRKGTVFDVIMRINSIDIETKEWSTTDISAEDEQDILRLAKDPDIVNKIINSIAPTIYGLKMEKMGLALQLFSGVSKKMPDGTTIRGDIHILLVGDPGTAKSQLLRYISNLAPRGIYASGKSSSAAGLTAAAVRDESTGRWTLEAGALVLADLGIACVDEIDKMTPQDRSSMHEAMEQQTVTVAKAGINTTLLSRCAILGAANPRYGRFEPERPIVDQINLLPTLLSRFDLIFLIRDVPDEDRDSRISSHILNVHMFGELKEQVEKGIISEELLSKYRGDEVKPEIPPEMLRKYIAYAKRHVVPTLTSEAAETIKNYYVSVRKSATMEGEEQRPIPMTVRQLEAFIRLAEASARMRLSNKVEKEDADRAIRIVRHSLEATAMENGQLDVDLISTGMSRKRRSEVMRMLEVLSELAEEYGERPIAEEEILENAQAAGIEREKALLLLKKLRENGEIYMPKAGHYKLVR